MPNETILLSDVGGTNIRFALYRHGVLSEKITYDCIKGTAFKDYVERFWQEIQQLEAGWTKPHCAIVGAAGLIEGNVVYSKNCPIPISKQSIQEWGFDEVDIENDFVTQSRAVKSSSVHDFIWQKGAEQTLNGTVMVVGPGTGLGMSVIHESSKKRMLPRAAEAGFTTLPLLEGASKKQNKAIEILREYMKRKHKSRLVYDQIVSGTGIMRLFYARKHVDDLKKDKNLQFNLSRVPSDDEKGMSIPDKLKNNIRLNAYEICRMAEKGDRTAIESVDYFLSYLGRFAGDQANVNLPDVIIFAGGVMCDAYIQKRMFEKGSPFLKEYKKARLKGGKKERPMGISKNRAVAFTGLVVAAEEKLRKRRDAMYLKMSALSYFNPDDLACTLLNKNVIKDYGNQTLNPADASTLDIHFSREKVKSGMNIAAAGVVRTFTMNTGR